METILSIIAIVISVISGVFSGITFWWTAKRDRKQATLEAYNRLQNEVFDALNVYMPSEIEEFCEDRRSAEYKVLSGYLARVEHFCVGVNEKIYDYDTFYALAHGYFDGHQLRKRLEPLLESKHRGKNGYELYYPNIYAVWNRMNANNKKAASK